MSHTLAHVTLVVPDYDEAIAWFTDALRFEQVEDTPVEDGKRWVLVRPRGSRGTSLLLARAASAEQSAHIGNQTGGRVALFLHTDDFAGDRAHMSARGVRFTEQPRLEPYGRVVVFEDPWGNRWDLVERSAAPPHEPAHPGASAPSFEMAPGHGSARTREPASDRESAPPRGPQPGDLRAYNREAWNRQVERGNRWTRPVGPDVIREAREGRWAILLTPTRPVPREWFPPLAGADVLALASGGGQQGPVLAAAGARVTVYDNSPAQLAQDRKVAEREGLVLTSIEGDMRDLRAFADASFDLVFHPCSNSFVPDVEVVWREAHRVLRPGGTLLAGFTNPAAYLFDERAALAGELRVRFTLPYADVTSLTADELRVLREAGEPCSFSHSLEAQIGGQARAGFRLLDLFEDVMADDPLSRFMPPYVATRAVRVG